MKVTRAVGFEEKIVAAVIAVHSADTKSLHDEPSGAYMDNKKHQCRTVAAKVTQGVAAWIMKWHKRA